MRLRPGTYEAGKVREAKKRTPRLPGEKEDGAWTRSRQSKQTSRPGPRSGDGRLVPGGLGRRPRRMSCSETSTASRAKRRGRLGEQDRAGDDGGAPGPGRVRARALRSSSGRAARACSRSSSMRAALRTWPCGGRRAVDRGELRRGPGHGDAALGADVVGDRLGVDAGGRRPASASSSSAGGRVGCEGGARSGAPRRPGWETWKSIAWPRPTTNSVEPPPMSIITVGRRVGRVALARRPEEAQAGLLVAGEEPSRRGP